ncbi:hypothetical protein ACOSP7_028753 [Xanthoceras sorbifolium]
MICKMRETINKWVSSPQVEIQTMATRMIVKFEKYWSDIPGVMAVAAVLDPSSDEQEMGTPIKDLLNEVSPPHNTLSHERVRRKNSLQEVQSGIVPVLSIRATRKVGFQIRCQRYFADIALLKIDKS